MNLDLYLFTKERPEIDGFLLNRYDVEPKGTGNVISDLMDRYAQEKKIAVIWGNNEMNFVNLSIEEACYDFYPRLPEETKIDYMHQREGLPHTLVSYGSRGVRLIGNEELWGKVKGTELIANPPERYKRFFRVLEWTKGQPVYNTHFAVCCGNEEGLINAAGLARILSKKFDGRIWDPTNHKLGSPDVEAIIANCGDLGWLWNVFSEKN